MDTLGADSVRKKFQFKDQGDQDFNRQNEFYRDLNLQDSDDQEEQQIM
jgi:hypothetical protein